MKFLVFSDLHGDVNSLQKILMLEEKEHCDFFLFLGDMFSYKEKVEGIYDDEFVLSCFNEISHKLIAVEGNCDYFYSFDEQLKFKVHANDEILLKDRKIVLTHGHKFSSYDFALKNGDIFISGHTHRIKLYKDNSGVIYLNPGSCSLPRGEFKETIAIMDEKEIKIVDLDGNVIMNLNLL